MANSNIVQELGFFQKEILPEVYLPNQWKSPVMTLAPYGPCAKVSIAHLDTHISQKQYQSLASSEAMMDVMTQLALDPKALGSYKADHRAFLTP